MQTRTGKALGVVAATAAIALSLPVAVSAHADDPTPTPTPTTTPTTTPSTPVAPIPNPEGQGCDAYKQAVATGPGSFTSMATGSLSSAVANNPQLTTLSAALSGRLNPQVNLVNTLDAGQYILFAPVDDAFAKLPPEQLNALKTDPVALTSLLDYHAVLGLLGPGDVHGKLTTLQGKQVTVKGSGGDITVDDAKVVCGGIHTSGSIIYMIDTVLDPASAQSTTATTSTSTATSTSTTETTAAPSTTPTPAR